MSTDDWMSLCIAMVFGMITGLVATLRTGWWFYKLRHKTWHWMSHRVTNTQHATALVFGSAAGYGGWVLGHWMM